MLLSQEDIRRIEARGSSAAKVQAQVDRFKKGFPWMKIVGPATPDRGIEVLSEAEADEAVAYADRSSVAGR